jgi:hypothetical protein
MRGTPECVSVSSHPAASPLRPRLVIPEFQLSGLFPPSFFHLLRVKEDHPLRGLHRFSPVPNIYNNLGNLPFARTQPKRPHQIEFGHSYDTAKSQVLPLS